MIRIDKLRFAWPQDRADCLNIEHLSVPAGRTLFLHGPSGCGKSTLLGLLAGVLVPRAGRVEPARRRLVHACPAARRDALRADHVGYIFQQFNLLPYLNAARQRAAAVPLLGAAPPARRQPAARHAPRRESLLQRVGLPQAAWQRRAGALSVGQQQRVAAARALIGPPEVVIADEPTSALDAALRDGFMDLLLGECRAAGSTLVFVSHDRRLATRFDRQLSLAAINLADQDRRSRHDVA